MVFIKMWIRARLSKVYMKEIKQGSVWLVRPKTSFGKLDL